MNFLRSELNTPPWRAESSPAQSSSEPPSLILCCFKPCNLIQILFCSLHVVFAFSYVLHWRKILDWPILDWPNSPPGEGRTGLWHQWDKNKSLLLNFAKYFYNFTFYFIRPSFGDTSQCFLNVPSGWIIRRTGPGFYLKHLQFLKIEYLQWTIAFFFPF